MYKKLLLLGITIFLVNGCSNGPRQVKAELALVNAPTSIVGAKVPTEFRLILEDKQTKKTKHKDYEIQLGDLYTSSLGQECRGLTVFTLGGEKSSRVVCTEPRQYPNQIRAWYLMPNIVHSTTSIKL